jgi:hypothetical protein
MSFTDVLIALHAQVRDDSGLNDHVRNSSVLIGFRENLPQQEYMIIVEPMDELEPEEVTAYQKIIEQTYVFNIYARMSVPGIGQQGMIIGSRTKIGLLDFIKKVKEAIRTDKTLGYDSPSTSLSAPKTSGTYALTPSAKFLTVKIGGLERTGYDSILAGDSSLPGATIASNIQTAIRDLSMQADDGYAEATCTFDSTKNQFTITAGYDGPRTTVEVTAGGSNDCSAILGFDNPVETVGTNITKITFGPVTANNEFYPIRYRIMPVFVTEEVRA